MKPNLDVSFSMDEPVLIMHGPATDTPWGVCQFPDMWRGCDGAVYLCVNMGVDCNLGDHEESCWFKSDNNGATCSRIPLEHVDLRPDVVELPDGGAISLASNVTSITGRHSAPGTNGPIFTPRNGGVAAVAEPFDYKYGRRYDAIYRFGDFSADARQWPCRIRMPDGQWEDSSFSVEAPELRKCGIVRQQLFFEKEQTWKDVEPYLDPPVPSKVTRLGDRSLVTPVYGQHPEVLDRYFAVVHCLASVDGGRTWDIRGTVADQIGLVTHGFGGDE